MPLLVARDEAGVNPFLPVCVLAASGFKPLVTKRDSRSLRTRGLAAILRSQFCDSVRNVGPTTIGVFGVRRVCPE